MRERENQQTHACVKERERERERERDTGNQRERECLNVRRGGNEILRETGRETGDGSARKGKERKRVRRVRRVRKMKWKKEIQEARIPGERG